jgi:citrate lyase beta subunit
MLLTLITNEVDLAQRAEAAGIDRIMIDLERKGKAQRQAGRDLFLSDHTWGDVDLILGAMHSAQLHVRINPWHRNSPREINEAISRGASIVMLPMIRELDDGRRFVGAVNGRARTSLLVETGAGLEQASELTAIKGIDEIHIGLNDLAIDLGRTVIFEVVCERMLDSIAAACHRAGIIFGFGGVACDSAKPLPVSPELILAEQARLKSEVGLLGRSFRRLCGEASSQQLARDVRWIRETLKQCLDAGPAVYERNLSRLRTEVDAWKKSVTATPARRDG